MVILYTQAAILSSGTVKTRRMGSRKMEAQTDSGKWVREHIVDLVATLQPEYFKSKRWFGSKGRKIKSFGLIDFAVLSEQSVLTVLLLLRIGYQEGNTEFYHLPLLLQSAFDAPTTITSQPNAIAATLDTPQGELVAYDAFANEDFLRTFYHNMFENHQFESGLGEGRFVFANVAGRIDQPEVEAVKLIATEQSNTSVVYNGKLILKCFRKLAAGKNPDFEIPLFLTTNTDFRYVPKLAGYIEYEQTKGNPVSIGVLQDFIKNNGDGYNFTLEHLRDFFKQLEPELLAGSLQNLGDNARTERAQQLAAPYVGAARQLGQITGQLHNALASEEAQQDPAFVPELITAQDTNKWQASIEKLIDTIMDTATKYLANAPAELKQQLESIAANKQAYLDVVARVNELPQAGVNKIRYHGDYHLGQVLKTDEGFMVLDFEGEPARTLEERRAKYCPLKDVTGMLRSFDYAAYTVLFEQQEKLGEKVAAGELERWALAWEGVARTAFLAGYLEAVKANRGAKFLPDSPQALQQAMDVFETEKAFYELLYEINNRPNWIAMPLKGLQRISKQ